MGSKFVLHFFDVQKAFDLVPHPPLLQKLADIGINPHLLKWIQSYQQAGNMHTQFVSVEGASSPTHTLQVHSGIPQGSVLGLLLFILYLSDGLHQNFDDSRGKLFADDIALYRIIRSSEDYTTLQANKNAVGDCQMPNFSH